MNTLYCIDTQKFCILAIRAPEPDSVSSGDPPDLTNER